MEALKETVPCGMAIIACVILTFAYVASLYVWSPHESRDHPAVIVRRFYGVFAMMCLSPPLVYMFMSENVMRKTSLLHLLGLRWDGLLPAIFIPLGLTMILFLGPLSMQGMTGLWRLYAEPMYWVWNITDLVFLRSFVVAPLAEEFVFRACMLPLLMQCYRPVTAIFIAPVFFGVAHLHHIIDRVKHERLSFKVAFVVSCFQMSYTTMFGAYSAFLFLRTGHLIAPCVAHAFCNHMGFPDFTEVLTYKNPQKLVVGVLFVLGLVLWCILLAPVTNPSIYYNTLYWKPPS